MTDVISSRPGLSTLEKLLMTPKGEALQELFDSGKLTLIAPNDKAWEALGPDVMAKMEADQATFDEVCAFALWT